MKSHSLIPSRAALTVMCGIAFAAGIIPIRARADAWDKKTILTVNQTIQVKDTVLEPGQYVMKLLNSNSDRHIVQIFNARENHIYGTILAVSKQRMEPTGDTQFQFWETPAGKARALRALFYPGDLIGQEFPYPKHLADVAMMETQTTTTPQSYVSERKSEETTTNQQVEEQKPVETAEAAPPPPPPETEAEQPPAAEQPAPAPAPAPQPATELPKTSTLYPLAGLGGGVLLGLYSLLRLKRHA